MNLNRPDFILIGAAERNVGKTEFACELIQRHASKQAVIGVKTKPDPALSEPYRLTEETDDSTGKDTARMLAAGAKKVYFLRVQPDRLAEGLAALLDVLPAQSCVVCESTRLRQLLEPGLFLLLKKTGSTTLKPSCGKLIGFADQIIQFDGTGWDFQPDQIHFHPPTWSLKT